MKRRTKISEESYALRLMKDAQQEVEEMDYVVSMDQLSTRNKFVTCRHDGCNEKAQFKGLCRGHGGKKCKVEGCTDIRFYRDYCNKHTTLYSS